jgi:hypothetical protein
MKPYRISKSQSGLLTEIGQIVYIGACAVALSMCVYCLGKGKDLYAAYWAILSLVAPRIESWFREPE